MCSADAATAQPPISSASTVNRKSHFSFFIRIASVAMRRG